jgi:hypothetical protein
MHDRYQKFIKICSKLPERKILHGSPMRKLEENTELNKSGRRLWTGLIWYGIRTSGEQGNECSGSVKGGEYID